ncbi:MAG: class I SAM-dependent methyltransferase [Polyangiaceae bacterium]
MRGKKPKARRGRGFGRDLVIGPGGRLILGRPFLQGLYGPDLAFVHHVGFGALARNVAPELLELLARAELRSGLVIDLGAGSGILSAELGHAGYEVLAVDVSPSMLEIARKIAPKAELVHGSLHETAFRPCVALFAVGEGIAYFDPDGPMPYLPKLFRRAFWALEPGGLFAFDLLVREPGVSFETQRFVDKEDFAVLSATHDRGETIERVITTFRQRQDGGAFERTREVHRQRVVQEAHVLEDLEIAGFQAVSSKSYGKVPLLPGRRAFFATRP